MNKKLFVRLTIILASTWFVLLAFVFIANLRYKDHVISLMKDYLNNHLQTEIHIRKNDIRFHVISSFPYASIELNNILIKSPPGPDYSQFTNREKDTLLFAEKLSFALNLWSIISKNVELKKIEITNAQINLLTDLFGKDNYHIIKRNTEKANSDSVSIDLKSINLKNVRYQYINKKPDMLFSGLIQSGTLSGSFEENDFNLKTNFKGNHFSLISNKKVYFDRQPCSAKADIERKKDLFIINNSDFLLAGLRLKVDAKWNLSNKYYTVSINCNNANLQSIDKSILQPFTIDPKNYPIKGILKFHATLNGYTSEKTPAYSINFNLNNTSFAEKTLKIPFTITYAKGEISNIKNRKKTTPYLLVDSLSAASNKSIIYCKGRIDNFETPRINGQFWGELDTEKLFESENLKNKFDFKGIVKISLVTSGRLNSLNSIGYEDINKLNIEGKLTFTNLLIKPLSNTLPAAIASGEIKFNQLNKVYLKNLLLIIGKSDLLVNGTVNNIPLFATDHKMMPEYQCKIRSEEFHVEDFLIKENIKKSGYSKKAVFPDSIKVMAFFSAKKFIFGKFEAGDVGGEIEYSPKTLAISDFYMQSQEGTIHSTITINQHDELFITTCRANLLNLDINNLFYAFNNFGQTVISSENLSGRLSGPVYVTAAWDAYLNPVYNKLYLESEVEINNGKIINYSPLLGLSKYIEVDELKNIRFDQLKTNILINDKTVFISQTDIHSSAMNLTGSGEHHFDNNYVYRLQVQLSDVLWNKAGKKKPENTEFGYIVDDGLGRTTLPLVIHGKGTEYNVSYDKRTAGGILKEKLKKEKQELKNLFSLEDSQKINFNTDQKEQIIWEENEPEKTKDNNKTVKEKNEFSVEWEDN